MGKRPRLGAARSGEALGLGLAGWIDSGEERAQQRQGHQGHAVRLREPGAQWAPPPLPFQRPLQKCGSSNGPVRIRWDGGTRRQRGSAQDELWPCRALCGRAVAQAPGPPHSETRPFRGARGCAPCSCMQGLPVGQRGDTLVHPLGQPPPTLLPSPRWPVPTLAAENPSPTTAPSMRR